MVHIVATERGGNGRKVRLRRGSIEAAKFGRRPSKSQGSSEALVAVNAQISAAIKLIEDKTRAVNQTGNTQLKPLSVSEGQGPGVILSKVSELSNAVSEIARTVLDLNPQIRKKIKFKPIFESLNGAIAACFAVRDSLHNLPCEETMHKFALAITIKSLMIQTFRNKGPRAARNFLGKQVDFMIDGNLPELRKLVTRATRYAARHQQE